MRTKIIKNLEAMIDPSAIMSVVVALVILAVGVFAFFTVIQNIPLSTNQSSSKETAFTSAAANITSTGDSIFNILGIVITIGAIMAILGVISSFVTGGSSDSSYSRPEKIKRIKEPKQPKEPKQMKQPKENIDEKEQAAKKLKEQFDRGEITVQQYAQGMLRL